MINLFKYLQMKIDQLGKSDYYNEHGYWLFLDKNGTGKLWVSWPKGFKPKKYRSC